MDSLSKCPSSLWIAIWKILICNSSSNLLERLCKPGGHIPAEKNYGDVDILAIDHQNKIIYSVECKNLVGARNIHEMKVEVDLYLGREGQQNKAKINKHVDRDLFLKDLFQLVHNFLQLEDDQYSLVSLIVASD